MTTPKTLPTQAGIAVSTAIVAGIGGDVPGERQQHAEGIIVSTAIVAGIGGDIPGERNQHAEGIVVSTAISAGVIGVILNHAEGIVAL
jgi:hypothetical protein